MFTSGFINVYFLAPPKEVKSEEPKKKNGASSKPSQANGGGDDNNDDDDDKEEEFNYNQVWNDLNKVKVAMALMLTPLVDPLVFMILTWT